MEKHIPQYQKSLYQDIKVLYVEDEVFSREKLLRVLSRRFANVYVAIDGIEGYQLYEKYEPDLIIADIQMNQMSGLEMISKIRELNDKVQIIVTTAHDDNEFFIQSIENSVNHFILKPIDLKRFLIAIQKSIYQIQLEKEKNELLAMMDPLTNSYNRLKFEELLDSEIRRTERYNNAFSIILMDIDYFKNVNDQFGHQNGDEVLITMATIAQQRIRECDIFARWGGEEFIILTPNTNLDGAKVLAESIRTLIEGFHFEKAGKLTCSFGVAEFTIGKSKREVILEADKALFQSKNKGRNCVTAAGVSDV